MQLLSVQRLWHDARHNAFTDICRFKNNYYLCFRTGETHYTIDGVLHILSSEDGERWQQCASLQMADTDLRDPKFSLAPDGGLLLHSLQVTREGDRLERVSCVFRSEDGQNWGPAHEVGEANIWMWRAHWQQGQCYSIGYSCRKPLLTRLYRSDDGLHYQTLVPTLFDDGFSNESDWVYLEDGTMVVLLRRDGEQNNSAMLGLAPPDYTHWQWYDLQQAIGGPNLLRLSDGRIIAAIRTYGEKEARTGLHRLDLEGRCLEPLLELPSGGDCSYAGMIEVEGELWVSYYSSHEENSTDIYLARVRL